MRRIALVLSALVIGASLIGVTSAATAAPATKTGAKATTTHSSVLTPARMHRTRIGASSLLWNSYYPSWVPEYPAPSTYLYVNAWVPNGSRFWMQCWSWGQNFHGNYWSSKWFWGTLKNGQWGYVHSSYVYYQIWVPYCG